MTKFIDKTIETKKEKYNTDMPIINILEKYGSKYNTICSNYNAYDALKDIKELLRKEKKPTEFVSCIIANCTKFNTFKLNKPNSFDCVELLFKKEDSSYEYDLMCAYNNEESKILYLGHWNGGC